MNSSFFALRSLKTRVTLFTLGIFLISIWSIAFYASQMLRGDMQRVLGDEQFSTASFIAAGVNEDLDDRLRALEHYSTGRIDPSMMGNALALQTRLEGSPTIQRMFNAGVFVTGIDGTAIASVPISVQRVGINYMERDHIAAALKDGKSTVSKPAIGKVLHAPVFAMAVPIRGAQGKVIGALVGVIDLSAPNFLDKVAENYYGKTGGYLLAAPQHNVFVTASDKSRIMQPLPAPGVNPMHDRYMQGFEGYGVATNSRGVEELSAAKRIPVAGWFIVAVLPTAEAFAPIYAMQRRMLMVTMILTLLAGGLTWWMLKRQLSPMLDTVKTLTTLSRSNQHPQPLPILRQDEIGDLIGGFNGLLEALGYREEALRASNIILQSILETTLDGFWRLDHDGNLLDVNPAYIQQSGYTREELLGMRITDLDAEENSAEITQHIQRIIETGGDQFESRHRRKDGSLWHVEVSTTYRSLEGGQFFVFLRDITARKQAEEALRDNASKLKLLSRHVLEAQETERRRLAIELHDELGQALTAIKINLQAHQRFKDQPPAEINAENISIVEDALRQVRRLALALRPSMLDDLGLIPALRWIAEQTEARGDLVVQFDTTMLKSRLAPEIETACFRIVQECLNNIVRHAKARQVKIDLHQDADTLVLGVEDDGCGFDPAAMRERALAGVSMGLLGMQERATLVGGQLDIRSTAGQGSSVYLRCPLRMRRDVM